MTEDERKLHTASYLKTAQTRANTTMKLLSRHLSNLKEKPDEDNLGLLRQFTTTLLLHHQKLKDIYNDLVK